MAFSEPMIGGTQACQQEPVTKTGRRLPRFFRRLRYGLAARWALYTVIIGTVVTAILTSYMYQGGVQALVSGELHELAATNQAAALRFSAHIAFASEDAVILAGTPGFARYMSARANGGIDPLSSAGMQMALSGLAANFRTVLEERSDYLQLRYIAADGHEIIRMERMANGHIQTTPTQALGDLSNRAYFREAVGLPKGAVYISDFDLNQPGGVIEQPRRAVVRAAAPAYDADGHLLGVAVINVDLDKLFDIVTQTARQQALHYIANQDGDFLHHPDPQKTFGFLLGHRYLMQDALPQLASLFGAGNASFSGLVSNGAQQYVTDARRIHYDPREPQRYLVLATLRPRSYVAEDITALRNRTLLMAAVMMVVGTLAVVWLANRLARPVHALTAASASIAAGEREIAVDAAARRKDEVGDLARSFRSMAAEIRIREDKIRANTEEVARSNKELAQFAYIASHDLQEPLRMVDSYLGLLERRYADKLDGEALEFIGFAVDGARRMKLLINDLLAYSRVSNRPLSRDLVDTGAVVAGVLKLVAQDIADSGAKVTVATLPEIEADRPQMDRLFTNLVENALKYRSDAAPEIRIAAVRKDRFWEFSIADNGIGIDPQFHEKVFEVFARLHSRERYQGSGIGLASCRRIVERHGGEIWFESAPGAGATFYFTLPATDAARESGDA